MKAHLSILAAFRAWRQRHDSERVLLAALESGAIEYQQWAARGAASESARHKDEAAHEDGSKAALAPPGGMTACQMPPSLPALMSWHAHMLSPRQYHAEAESTYEHLQDRSFPFEQAVSQSTALAVRSLSSRC